MSLPESEHLAREAARRALATAVLVGVLSFAGEELPAWRLEPRPAPAAVLLVGDPTPGIAYPPVGRLGTIGQR